MKKSLFLLFLSLFLISPFFVIHAQDPVVTGDAQKIQTGDAKEDSGSVRLDNPLGTEVNDVPTLIGKVISGVLSVVGSLALVMFIYGGFTWMLAAGNTEKVKKGRDILIWAALGLVIIFTSYAMVTYVITTISKT